MLSARLAACSAAALLIGVSGGMLESVVPAGAAVTDAALANGWATCTPGSTAPVTFDVLSLVTAGASNVDATSLTVVTAPPFADATATVTAPGSIRLTPVATASGTFSLTFGLCAPGVATWTASDPACTRARLTYAQPVPQTMGYHFTLAGPRSGREALDLAVDAPSIAPATGVFTMTVALAPITVPLQQTGFGVSYVDAIAIMLPVPAGLTYVPTSALAVGGTARIDRGTTVTYCTAPAAGCTGTDSGDYHTTSPYLELRTGTTSTGGIAGGTSATLPTIRAEFKATGPVGTTVSMQAAQFRMNVSTVLAATVNSFPSANTGANPPPYEAPAVLSTTTIVASAPAPTITGFTPAIEPTAGGATVTITGTNLTGTTAVTFGATAATTVAVAPTGGSLTVVVPAHPAGAVKLSVTTPGGTVAAAGTFTFAPATLATLSVATTSLTTGTEGSVYSATLAATGATVPYTWTATGLPGGLHLSRTGLIAGIPTAPGVFTVHVSVTGAGAGAPTATATLTLTVIGPPPAVSTTHLPAGSEGAAYSAALTATGGAAPYTWVATGLPHGLHLSQTGLISGTPSTPGASTISFTVTGTTGRRASSTFTLSVTGALAITTASLPTAVVGFPYSSTLSASGGLPPYSWAASGLPAGIAADTTGSITGTPVATGASKVTITLTGQTGETTSTSLTLVTTTTPVPATGGYWTPTASGGMLAFGPGAQRAGSMNDQRLDAPVVGMAATPTGGGYWEVAADGGIFAFGPGAPFYGSAGGKPLDRPIVGIAAAPSTPIRQPIYLALGDSAPVWNGSASYPDLITTHYQTSVPGLRLVNLAQSGATTTSMLHSYGARTTSQEQLAELYLRAHRGSVALVTIDIGGNDLLPCANDVFGGGGTPTSCFDAVEARTVANLHTILTGLRQAAGPGVRFVEMTYYNPFLGNWLAGGSSRVSAVASTPYLVHFNNVLTATYAQTGMPVADVGSAMEATDMSTSVPSPWGNVPVAVTRACSLLDIGCAVGQQESFGDDPNLAGAAVIAQAFEKTIDTLSPP